MIGFPVYLHYCGGELEKINYVVKSSSCCDGEQDDTSAQDDGCCTDENLVIKSNADFTLKHFHSYDVVKTFHELFFVSLPFLDETFQTTNFSKKETPDFSPEKILQKLIVSSSVIRI